MMSHKEYIINKLNKLSELFPFYKFKYKFLEYHDTNIINVHPKENAINDLEYIEEEEKFYFEFIKKYPDFLISFDSDIRETELKPYDYVIQGINIITAGYIVSKALYFASDKSILFEENKIETALIRNQNSCKTYFNYEISNEDSLEINLFKNGEEIKQDIFKKLSKNLLATGS